MNASWSNENLAATATASRPLNASLSSSLPAHRLGLSKRRQRSTGEGILSASIPLPKSHIHRTPSELQLADDQRRAEYEDVRMYARLVVGMQSQCVVSGYVHPLTKKSLQDILKTKQADERDLEKLHAHDEEGSDFEDNEDYQFSGLSHDRDQDENSVDTPLPCQPLGTAAKEPTVVKTPSSGSIASELSGGFVPTVEDEDEDECVFSLEL
jgi:hypothetical protein